jgi:fructokinase
MSIDILFLGGTSIDLIQDKKPNLYIASVGGGITNSAIVAAKLGLNVALLSKIGKDPLGDFAVNFLGACRVNTKGVIQDPSIKTPIAVAAIDKSGNSKYTFYKNPSKDSIVPLQTIIKSLLNCRIFHFGSSFSYQKETSKEALKYVRFFKNRGVFISFDPNLRPYAIKDKKAAKNRVLKLLKWVDLAKLSETDLKFLSGQKDPQKSLKWLKRRFKCEIVLTLGPKGSVYLDSNGKLIGVPAFKVKVADTIGAGDGFTAGILYKIAEEGKGQAFDNIKSTLTFASTISAIICTAKGANQGLKNIKQVKTFINHPRSCIVMRKRGGIGE